MAGKQAALEGAKRLGGADNFGSAANKMLNGTRLAGRVLTVTSVGLTLHQAYGDAANGRHYKAGARLAVTSLAIGATAVPIVGWGLAIGIGVADMIWGSSFTIM